PSDPQGRSTPIPAGRQTARQKLQDLLMEDDFVAAKAYPGIAPCAEEFLQNEALYFSCTGHRPVVYENYAARDFKAREVLTTVMHDLFFGNRLASFQLEENCSDFHQPIIGHTATACFTAPCFKRTASTSAAGWTFTPSDSSSEQQTSMING